MPDREGDPGGWRIAPGEQAKFWDTWRTEAIIEIGGDGLGDISGLSKEQFDAKVAAEISAGAGWKKAGFGQVWRFAREMRVGDWVVATHGIKRVLGIGQVTSDYFFQAQEGHYGHRRKVRWDDLAQREIQEPAWTNSIGRLTPAKLEEIRSAPGGKQLPITGRDTPVVPVQTPPAQHSGRPPQIWWVNQSGSYPQERAAGCLWAAQHTPSGRTLEARSRVLEVRAGDITVHNRSGQVVAIGRALTKGKEVSRAPYGEPSAKASDPGWHVAVEYCHLDRPVPVKEVSSRLMALGIPEGPLNRNGTPKEGYLWPFSMDGLTVIRSASADAWPDWPGLVGAPAPKSSFEAIRAKLREKGLCFRDEDLANYLLALQAKRLVILSGMSGTGKTQLAKAVAECYAPAGPEPAGAADGGVDVTVRPYMLKFNRFVLPAAVRSFLDLPDPDGGASPQPLKVTYPEGTAELTVSRAASALQVLFKGAFREWFASTLGVGQRFRVEAAAGDEGQPAGLRVSVPVSGPGVALPGRTEVVAVRPDWTDNHALLGYLNPITRSYVVTPFLQLLLDAHAACQRRKDAPPFFAILDEMNLARVEHYFSDFLSCLESGQPLHLHDEQPVESGEAPDSPAVPRRLPVPPNLFFTGTVNVDETTCMFSPKVVDRAFTIELNGVDLAALGRSVDEPKGPLTLHALPDHLAYRGNPGSYNAGAGHDWVDFGALGDGKPRELVEALHRVLEDHHRHFGYRVANEIARFVVLAHEQTGGSAEALWPALDLAILQKVLPKFHGTQQELEQPLAAMFSFAVTGDKGRAAKWTDHRLDGGRLVRAVESAPPAADQGADGGQSGSAADSLTEARLPRTALKAWRMLRRLRDQGFTAYME